MSADRLSILAWAVLAAAVLDAAENAMLWQVLVLQTGGFAEAATVFAVGKFALLTIAALATPVILVIGGREAAGAISSEVEDRPPAPHR